MGKSLHSCLKRRRETLMWPLPEENWVVRSMDPRIDRYRSVAVDRPGDENTFKFYQMDITLSAA